VVFLSHLNVKASEEWLRSQGGSPLGNIADRPLRACLICRFGQGIIFVDGTDDESEQRLSLAHELAHFLVDYLAPRHAAVARLGEQILDVLDGRRSARPEERLVGILANVEVRHHIHLMSRFEYLNMSAEIERSEFMADVLALELIAPWTDVSQRIASLGIGTDQSAISGLLVKRYGLPILAADRYAARFCPDPQLTSQLLRHLRHVELATPPRNRD
jgi:hypothetical protein